MSHYGLNASVPKSLIQCLIQWQIDTDDDKTAFQKAKKILAQILAVEISPELIPQDESSNKKMQSTEDSIGPYDLHDFQLFYVTRHGFAPAKCAFLAAHAWSSKRERKQSSASSVLKERDFTLAEVLKHQRCFLRRFFLTSQFKRTCVPNGPKVADGGESL
jgi:NAD+ synthase (glutamine-hydrolysing)